MGVIANITVGASNLYIAPAGTALPNLTGAASDFGGAFTEVGFTQDGIEYDYTPTWKDIMVDELMGPAKKILTAHKLIVSAKLAESTLENLKAAIPGSTLTGTTLTIGSVTEAPEFVLGWRGPSVNGGTRSALLSRVVSIGAVKAHYQRKDMVIYQTQFEALSDPTQAAAADLATVKDFTTPFVLA
jgi:hypothetical protein